MKEGPGGADLLRKKTDSVLSGSSECVYEQVREEREERERKRQRERGGEGICCRQGKA